MRAPLSWLRDFTPVEAAPDEIARTLSFLGLVVEGTEVVAPPWPGIVVARVISTRPHPAADRIQLVDVDAGDGEALQVCCGAFNMKAGDVVPLATVGAVMPNGTEIGRRKLRGEWSNGMLCSALEVGLGPEGPAPAIFIFPPGAYAFGQPLSEALGVAGDVVFDLEISPNRSDCFSVAGVARDLAAAMRLPFRIPEPAHLVSEGTERANVVVAPGAADLCPRFTGTVIENVDDASVPPLVPYRLTLVGMRPISPVVDVSNYVMMELGQPNHPYDLDRLGGRGLLVRRATEGEQLVTLDGTGRTLSPEDLVVADATGTAVGIAGIMGGAAAEIVAGTSTVLLEAANFDPLAVSATGQRLGLLSEARTRFERGVDIELAGRATDRFVELLGPGVRRGETSDVRGAHQGGEPVKLRAGRVNLVLGTALRPEQCAELLAPLGFEATADGAGDYEVAVPTWRPDCSREVDLIEEIARIYGYENIARALPNRPVAATGLTAYQKGRRRLREALAGAGADECWTPTFVSAADLALSGLDPGAALELENPLDQSQGLLRTSLLPGLLRAARFNVERQAGALSLFELGSVFCRPSAPGAGSGLVEGVYEWEQLGSLAVGPDVDAGYAVRAWEVVAGALRLEGASVAPVPGERADAGTALALLGPLHPTRRAIVLIGGRPAGALGELAPEVARRYDLAGRVAVLAVDLAPVLGGPERAWAARAVSKYPATDLDMAFVVDEDVPAARLGAAVTQAAGALLESVALFSAWRDASLGPGRRSLAFRARLRAPDHTLTKEEVAEVRANVAAAALEGCGAVLRTG
jgi:phenylalanyl-tRNA synthetase beta chain